MTLTAKIISCDLYRMKKSKLFYGVILLSGFLAFSLMLLNRQDIRLGISIFGNLTTFISAEDVVKLGIEYQKGLGLMAAVFISVFIGQENQWNTWQHKWLIGRTRAGIYLSKVLLSAILSTSLFILFEFIALICSEQISRLLESGYIQMLACGIAIYVALGSVFCLISMLIRNSVVSVTVSLGYVLCGEMIVSIMQDIARAIPATAHIISAWSEHTVYGMSVAVYSSPIATDLIISTAVSSLCISALTVLIGVWRFSKYEL